MLCSYYRTVWANQCSNSQHHPDDYLRDGHHGNSWRHPEQRKPPGNTCRRIYTPRRRLCQTGSWSSWLWRYFAPLVRTWSWWLTNIEISRCERFSLALFWYLWEWSTIMNVIDWCLFQLSCNHCFLFFISVIVHRP